LVHKANPAYVHSLAAPAVYAAPALPAAPAFLAAAPPAVLPVPDVRLYNGQIPTIAGAYAHHYAAPSYGFAVKK